MNGIRQLEETDLEAFARIAAAAYPAIEVASIEEFARDLGRRLAADPTTSLYGLFRGKKLLGGMRFFDFTMRMLSTTTLVGGLGLVAVDLLHKKEHVARDMIAFFLHHYRAKGACMTALYPFRPDFYTQMGFGYGAKMNQYRLKPASLPAGPTRAHVEFLTAEDKPALLDCYNRVMARTHGMMARSLVWADRVFATAGNRVVGVRRNEQIAGYLIFTFQHGATFLHNDIEVGELIYEDSAALAELLTFLRSQADQIQTIILNTQDEYFHHLPLDPRNGSGRIIPHIFHESNTAGVGLMYRVIDIAGAFRALADHDFGGQSCTLALTVHDSFLPTNAGRTTVTFVQGRPSVTPDAAADAAIELDVAAFSSLLMGAVDLLALHRYGLATISDLAYLPIVNRIFRTESKPVCFTRF